MTSQEADSVHERARNLVNGLAGVKVSDPLDEVRLIIVELASAIGKVSVRYVPDVYGEQFLAASGHLHSQDSRGIEQRIGGHGERVIETAAQLLGAAFPVAWATRIEKQELAAKAAAEDVRSAAQAILGDANNYIDRIRAADHEVESLIERAKELLETAAVERHTGHFADRADAYSKASKRWLGAGAVFATITALLGATFAFGWIPIEVDSGEGSASWLHQGIGRLVLLSVLSYALAFCLRNYAGARHNEEVNRHRANAVATFDAFHKAAGGDAVTKNAILLQMCTAIFAPQATGFSKAGEDHPAPNILDSIKSLAPKQ